MIPHMYMREWRPRSGDYPDPFGDGPNKWLPLIVIAATLILLYFI